MESWIVFLIMPSLVLLSSEITQVTNRNQPLKARSSLSSLSLSSSTNPIKGNGYTVESASFFSRVTRTFGSGSSSKTSISSSKSSKSTTNHAAHRSGLMTGKGTSDKEVEDYEERDFFATPPPDELTRRGDMSAKMAMKMAKKQNMMNMIKSMAGMKMKYKLKKQKMKYKLKKDKMKYKLKKQKIKSKKGCGKGCKMSVPQLVNFQKISYKKVPVPVHYKLYKRMMKGQVPLGEPFGEPLGEHEPFAESINQPEAESEPESWYGRPLGGIPEPFPEIAFPLPEPEVSINKKFVEYNFLDDEGSGQPTQDPLYVYEEEYDDEPTDPTTAPLFSVFG